MNTPSVRNPENRASIKRLTREHFALYRGYLDGVSIEQLHATYGDAATDVRGTRRLIGLLRDTLSSAARRTRDVEATHLLRLRPGSIPDAERVAASALPTLAAYREAVDPNGFHSEAELLELYRAEYSQENAPLDRRASRNARLRRRQADALARMENSLVQAPQPDHPVSSWLEPAIADRLQRAHIYTLADLLGFIERRGHRWHAGVERVGPKAARRIVDWLSLHADSLGHTLSKRAVTPRRRLASNDPALVRPRQQGIVPLEALDVPALLDGSAGTNRMVQPALDCGFDTDLQAINGWLTSRQHSLHTVRAYRRESERLLLWAIHAKGKALSSLSSGDCAEYIETFLIDPQPAARWIGSAKIERTHPDWRPFIGALSDRSRETARAILHAMGEWLVGQDYLANNPFARCASIATGPRIDVAGRSLSRGQWRNVVQSNTRVHYSERELRDFLALSLAYSTGLRRAELARATTSHLVKALSETSRNPDNLCWQLMVSGPDRRIPIPQSVVELLIASLRTRGLPGNPVACAPHTPLLANFRTGHSLTPDGIGQVFRRVLAGVIPKLARDPSTHWIRHTHSHHALRQGADCREIQARLGHAHLSTTRLYVKAVFVRGTT
ncbi:phage integrase family protein [Caballeronia sp. DA-9]|uniref:phage integrase family protein n=1 Tax=Caballeronia sp. DA-9 TaxID=3436237 RepID=UPI003F66C94F